MHPALSASREGAGVEVASRAVAEAALLDDAGGATDNVSIVAGCHPGTADAATASRKGAGVEVAADAVAVVANYKPPVTTVEKRKAPKARLP